MSSPLRCLRLILYYLLKCCVDCGHAHSSVALEIERYSLDAGNRYNPRVKMQRTRRKADSSEDQPLSHSQKDVWSQEEIKANSA